MVVAIGEIVLVALISYIIGSINLAIILSKAMGKGDIREFGSKNAGTTNVQRVLGNGPALLVIIWDILKGVLAVWIARFGFGVLEKALLNGQVSLPNVNMDYIYVISILFSSIAAILGHNYPIFFGFRGGKGVATSIGVLLSIEPKIGLICIVAGLVCVKLFDFISMGSIIGSIEYPILVCIIGGQFDQRFNTDVYTRGMYIVFSLIMAGMVIYRHKKNIERIKAGEENKFSLKKKNAEVAKLEVKEEVKPQAEKEVKEEAKPQAEKEAKEQKKEVVDEKVDIKFEPVNKDKKKSK